MTENVPSETVATPATVPAPPEVEALPLADSAAVVFDVVKQGSPSVYVIETHWGELRMPDNVHLTAFIYGWLAATGATAYVRRYPHLSRAWQTTVGVRAATEVRYPAAPAVVVVPRDPLDDLPF